MKPFKKPILFQKAEKEKSPTGLGYKKCSFLFSILGVLSLFIEIPPAFADEARNIIFRVPVNVDTLHADVERVGVSCRIQSRQNQSVGRTASEWIQVGNSRTVNRTFNVTVDFAPPDEVTDFRSYSCQLLLHNGEIQRGPSTDPATVNEWTLFRPESITLVNGLIHHD